MNEITSTNNQLSKGYAITCQQFIDDDYAGKVARGECEVFLYHAPPLENDTADNKRDYANMLKHYGNVDSIATIDDKGDGYYFAHSVPHPSGGKTTYGVDSSRQFIVWPKESEQS